MTVRLVLDRACSAFRGARVCGTPQPRSNDRASREEPGLRGTADPSHPSAFGWTLVVLCLLAGSSQLLADDSAVTIADFAGYQAALAAKANPSAAPLATFRELWDHPEAHQGRPVQVEGRVARLFRQASVGKFPPLAEAWVTSPVGDPTCLVFPTEPGRAIPKPGDQVRFVGTFLRRITYRGADTDRVAPLLVGPEPPTVLDPASGPGGDGWGSIFGGDHFGDWGIGLAASLGVLWVLLRRHLSRPLDPIQPIDPSPTFLDGDDDIDDDLEFSGADHVDR